MENCVNGVLATALLNSASTQMLVMPYLVQSQQVGNGVDVCCVHGDKQSYPTVPVYRYKTRVLRGESCTRLNLVVLLGLVVSMLSLNQLTW